MCQNTQDVVPLREALNMEIIVNQALIDILVVKGNPLDDLKALKNAQIVIHEGTIIRKPSK